jgi:hypothetical protein
LLLVGAISAMPAPTRSSPRRGPTVACCCALVLGASVACGSHGGASAIAAAGDDGGPAATAAYVTIPLSSCVPSTYTASVAIGGSQSFQLAVDTGSTTLGVASSSCSSCSGVTPLYDPGSSAVDERRQATARYETGRWSGEVYEDSVAAAPDANIALRLVAIDSQSEFFVPTECDSTSGSYQGVIGLGPSAAALTGTDGYLDRLVAAGRVADVFGMWLCDAGGTLWLGGWDPAATTGDPAYTPELSSLGGYYYTVKVAAIDVAGTRVPVPTARYDQSVVDAGSSAFVLPTPAFDALTTAIAGSPGFATVFGSVGASWFSDLGNCRALSQTKADLDALLPPLALELGDTPTTVVHATATESYLVPNGGQWCPAVYALDSSRNFPFAAILGSPLLRSNVAVFDRANRRVGFAPHAPCP